MPSFMYLVFLFTLTMVSSVTSFDLRSDYIEHLNKEYSPSQWSKRFLDGIDVVAVHVAVTTAESERVQQTYKYETISYGVNINEKFDIYGIDLPSDAPLFVYIHGGYWQLLDKNISAYSVEPLVAAGIKVIVLGYDLCPTVTLCELVEQVTKFGEFILRHSDYAKSRRIIYSGHSAGAHLILCMIDKLLNRISGPLRIDSIYLISGVYDLNELQYTNNNENNILSINNSNVDLLSPLKFDFTEWSKHNVDINIYVGQYDSPTFIRQSMELFLRFTNGFKVDFKLLNDYDHFEIVEDLRQKTYEITKSIVASSGNSSSAATFQNAHRTVVLAVILLPLLHYTYKFINLTYFV